MKVHHRLIYFSVSSFPLYLSLETTDEEQIRHLDYIYRPIRESQWLAILPVLRVCFLRPPPPCFMTFHPQLQGGGKILKFLGINFTTKLYLFTDSLKYCSLKT